MTKKDKDSNKRYSFRYAKINFTVAKSKDEAISHLQQHFGQLSRLPLEEFKKRVSFNRLTTPRGNPIEMWWCSE